MVQLPKTEMTPEAKLELLFNWYNKKQELQTVQAQERALRDTVVSIYLPEDQKKEGTNTVKLPTGDELKIVCGIDRKVDKAIFSNIVQELMEKGVDVNEVVETKVELRVGNYKKLTEEQRNVMDECVTSKWGSPQVSIKIKG
jgi:hypothetical protein